MSVCNFIIEKLKKFNLAIDGPTGSGKTTCGKILAKKLKLQFLDTGIFYRLFAYFLIKNKINWNDLERESYKNLKKFKPEWKNEKIYLEGEPIQHSLLFSFDIETKSRKIANLKKVRQKITKICRLIIAKKGFVLVGRDVTSVIAPESEIKIYLDAPKKIQSERKLKMFSNKMNKKPLTTWNKFIEKANIIEKNRQFGALKQVPDAIYLINDQKTPEKTIEKLLSLIKEKLNSEAIIAIVGESNVGKSTLFNCLIKQKKSIESNLKYTTRDEFKGSFSKDDTQAQIYDTGGWEEEKKEKLKNDWQEEINDRIKTLTKKATLILWVNDAQQNPSNNTKKINNWLKKYNDKLVLVLNKIDLCKKQTYDNNWKKLGIKNIIICSSKKGINIKSLIDLIKSKLKNTSSIKNINKKPNLMILGQTNAGKSSLFNLIAHENKAIISSQEHTTTNIVSSQSIQNNFSFNLLDTAGIRKSNRNKNEIEKKSLIQIKKNLSNIFLAMLVIDLERGSTVQDKKIIRLLQDRKIPFFIIGNKMDLVENNWKMTLIKFEQFWNYLKKQKDIIYISVKKKQNLKNLFLKIQSKLI